MTTPGNLLVLGEQTEYAFGSGIRATISQAFVNATASGNTQVVAANAGRKIRVLWCLAGNGGAAAINVNLQSATTAITATQPLAVNGGFAVNCQPAWFCETVAGEALNVNLSAVGTVGISLGYILV